MTKRELCLSKDGHDYVFQYHPGYEGEIIDEIMRLADDAEAYPTCAAALSEGLSAYTQRSSKSTVAFWMLRFRGETC